MQSSNILDANDARQAQFAKSIESIEDVAALRRHVQEIIEGRVFKGSHRSGRFLEYIVDQAIAGHFEALKERLIGVELFGRSPSYNTGEDAIVRVTANDVRKRLARHYERYGSDSGFHLSLPSGSYVPEITRSFNGELSLSAGSATRNHVDGRDIEGPFEPGVAVLEPAMFRERATHSSTAVSRTHLWILSGLIFALAIGWSITLIQNRTMHRALYPWKYSPAVGALWSGFLDNNQNTDVVMQDTGFLLIQTISGQAFSLDSYLDRSYLRQLQADNFSPELHFGLNVIASKNVSRAGEVKLVQRILLLDPLGKNLHFYHAREYMPALATQDNVILFGNPTANPWDELYENRLNFTQAAADGHDLIPVTNRAPAHGERATYIPSDTIQYCVVAYLPNPDHNGRILLIQGTSSEATEAGGDFLLSESQMSSFQRLLGTAKFPYFELLLKATAVQGTPITTSIEAYRTYPNLH